jgi:hypothetical protein
MVRDKIQTVTELLTTMVKKKIQTTWVSLTGQETMTKVLESLTAQGTTMKVLKIQVARQTQTTWESPRARGATIMAQGRKMALMPTKMEEQIRTAQGTLKTAQEIQMEQKTTKKVQQMKQASKPRAREREQSSCPATKVANRQSRDTFHNRWPREQCHRGSDHWPAQAFLRKSPSRRRIPIGRPRMPLWLQHHQQ